MLALENLGEYKSFKTSEFHAHGKYVPLIRWLGSATLASASLGHPQDHQGALPQQQ